MIIASKPVSCLQLDSTGAGYVATPKNLEARRFPLSGKSIIVTYWQNRCMHMLLRIPANASAHLQSCVSVKCMKSPDLHSDISIETPNCNLIPLGLLPSYFFVFCLPPAKIAPPSAPTEKYRAEERQSFPRGSAPREPNYLEPPWRYQLGGRAQSVSMVPLLARFMTRMSKNAVPIVL